MKNFVSLLCLCLTGFALACGDGGGGNTCTQNVGAGVTAVYQNGDTQVQVTGDANGNISVPCGATVTVVQ